jgi:nicotinate-nucleotide pyrophosphorylase (carboxylating)
MTKGLDPESLRSIVLAALEEDAAGNDVTVDFLGVGNRHITAKIVACAPGVLCGMDVAEAAFKAMDKKVLFERAAADGDALKENQLIAVIEGQAGGILSAERVALNFLQRLSGVATLTSRYVKQVSGTDIRILDTRKTTPMLRAVEKYAVRTGGGDNHRFDLQEMILIKENHTRSIGGIEALRKRLHRMDRSVPTEVEVDSLDFLNAILGAPFDRVMLDNFRPAQVEEAVRSIETYRQLHPDYSLEVEVSGGVDLQNIARYAIKGVDFISIGALTHSAPGLDMSMEFD